MKKIIILVLCLALATPATFAKKEKKTPVKVEQKAEKKQEKKSKEDYFLLSSNMTGKQIPIKCQRLKDFG